MKAINITSNTIKPRENHNSMVVDISDKQPCWYANFTFDGEDREEAYWTVGLKNIQEDNKNEYSFKLLKAGNVDSDIFWHKATSSNFAIKLLEL